MTNKDYVHLKKSFFLLMEVKVEIKRMMIEGKNDNFSFPCLSMLELPSISHRVGLSSLDKRRDSLNSERVLGFIKIFCKFYEKKKRKGNRVKTC